MKRLLAILPLVAALALPNPASAQASLDGLVDEVAYKGTSGWYDGVGLPFYQFEVTGLPGTPYWDFFCVDNLNYIHAGDTYDGRFTAVETGDLALTREGSDQLRMGTTSALGAALGNYRVAAYLYLQAMKEDIGTTAGKQALVDLQKAAWYATNPSYGAGNNSYYAAAQAAVAAGWRAEYFYVVTAIEDLTLDGSITARSGTQEYLVFVTPEPGTVILLATGLVGVAFVRRRRQLTDFEDTDA